MLVAVAQMTSGGVIRENLAIAQKLVRRAAMAGAKAVFLPEAADLLRHLRPCRPSPDRETTALSCRGCALQPGTWVYGLALVYMSHHHPHYRSQRGVIIRNC